MILAKILNIPQCQILLSRCRLPVGSRTLFQSTRLLRDGSSLATGATNTVASTPIQPPFRSSQRTLSSPLVVPLRKQLKDEAKASKLQNRGKKSRKHADRQVVPGWELIVGIEIHAQLNSQTKLFSAASADSSFSTGGSLFNGGYVANSNVAFFDLAIPGSQPQFQKEVLVPAVRSALALGCNVQEESQWDRKHYFWWDQPQGYQITQYYHPFAIDGRLTLAARDGIYVPPGDHSSNPVTIRIQRIQLEQDTAKTLAQPGKKQWIDFNRAGTPLVEIITEPDIRYPATAAAVVRKVQTILRAADACVEGMETGGLRADVNVSVRRTGDPMLGQRTEIKNLNSFRAIEDAIIAERDRQIAVLEQGGRIESETRGWRLGGSDTYRLRGKEGEVDYRYMPDPDLPPLRIGMDLVEHLRGTLGNSPDEELDALVAHYGLSEKDASTLVALDGGNRIEYFYNVVEDVSTRIGEAGGAIEIRPDGVPKHVSLVANWMLHELGRLSAADEDDKMLSPSSSASSDRRDLTTVCGLGISPTGQSERIPVSALGELLYHLYNRDVTANIAKEMLFALYRGNVLSRYASVSEALDDLNLWFHELSEDEYLHLCEEVLDSEGDTQLQHFIPAILAQQGNTDRVITKQGTENSREKEGEFGKKHQRNSVRKKKRQVPRGQAYVSCRPHDSSRSRRPDRPSQGTKFHEEEDRGESYATIST